jgi:hypothetical protein
MKFVKTFIPVFALIFVFGITDAKAVRGGTSGKVLKIQELPNSNPFKTVSYGFFDVGYTYNSFGISGLRLWNYDGQYCGYIGRKDKYLILNAETISVPVKDYNKFAAVNKLEKIELGNINSPKDVLRALETMYNNMGKAGKIKNYKPIKLELPASPKLPFMDRLGGKLIVGGGILLVLLFSVIGALKKRKTAF